MSGRVLCPKGRPVVRWGRKTLPDIQSSSAGDLVQGREEQRDRRFGAPGAQDRDIRAVGPAKLPGVEADDRLAVAQGKGDLGERAVGTADRDRALTTLHDEDVA